MRVALLVALAAAVVALPSCESDGPQFSDSPSAASIAFSTEGDRLDIAYEKCPGDPVPDISVSEDASPDGEGPPVQWTVTQRTSFPDGAFFIATRPSGAGDLPPAEDASVSVVVDFEDPVEVHGLRINDLPASEGDEVLTAEGETRTRAGVRSDVAKTCEG